MIFPAMDVIRQELNAGGVLAELGNISELASPAGNITGSDADIIISLVNIEENRVSRNPQGYLKSGTDLYLKNPAVHLYLTLLFTSAKNEAGYEKAILHVQEVVQFFQTKYVFDHLNTPSLAVYPGIDKLILDMVTLSLEQLNNLWSVLGGKYQPSVLYRMRMVTIDSIPGDKGSVVKEIDTIYDNPFQQ